MYKLNILIFFKNNICVKKTRLYITGFNTLSIVDKILIFN